MKKYIQISLALLFTFAYSQNIFAQGNAKQYAECTLGTSMGALAGLTLGSPAGPPGVVGGTLAGGVLGFTQTPACQNLDGSKGSGSGSNSASSGSGGSGGIKYATRIKKQQE